MLRNILLQDEDTCRESRAEGADCRADKQAGTLDEAAIKCGSVTPQSAVTATVVTIPLFSLLPFIAVAKARLVPPMQRFEMKPKMMGAQPSCAKLVTSIAM